MSNSIQAAARIIAKRQPEADSELLARVYLTNRRRRSMGASEALDRALGLRLADGQRPANLWYGNRGGFGAPFTRGGDVLRWTESTADAGLRFIGWADELPGGPDHTGWHTDEHGDLETLRGGVWQLPGRKGRARLVYGYTEWEGRGEMNPGSAALCVSDIVETEPCREWESVTDLPEIRDAARWADGVADSAAEAERDYRAAYDKGREAAEHDTAAIEARGELLPLLAELRTERRPVAISRFRPGSDRVEILARLATLEAAESWIETRSAVDREGVERGDYGIDAPESMVNGPRKGPRPAICAALRARVDSLLETISESRAARDSAWDSVWSGELEAAQCGFMDSASDGFRRAVALGYASRDDWRGAPELNPCGPCPDCGGAEPAFMGAICRTCEGDSA